MSQRYRGGADAYFKGQSVLSLLIKKSDFIGGKQGPKEIKAKPYGEVLNALFLRVNMEGK